MAKVGTIRVPVILDMDPIVILDCFAVDCVHNRLVHSGDTRCNMKRLCLDKCGKCMEYQSACVKRWETTRAEA